MEAEYDFVIKRLYIKTVNILFRSMKKLVKNFWYIYNNLLITIS